MKGKNNLLAIPALMLGITMVVFPLLGLGKPLLMSVMVKVGVLQLLFETPIVNNLLYFVLDPDKIPYYGWFIMMILLVVFKSLKNPKPNKIKDIPFKILIILMVRRTVMSTPLYTKFGINLLIPIILFVLSFGLCKFIFQNKIALVWITTTFIPLAIGILLGAVISPPWLSDSEIYWTFGLCIAFPLFFLKGISPYDYMKMENIFADCFNIFYKGMLVMFTLAFMIPAAVLLFILFHFLESVLDIISDDIYATPQGLCYRYEVEDIKYIRTSEQPWYQRLLN